MVSPNAGCRPELQVDVYLGGLLLGRVDKLWRAWNLVGEDHGRGKYVTVDDLHAEKIRQERLEAVGLEVVRWDWAPAWRPRGQLDVRVRRGREQGARKSLDPRARFVSTTVEQATARRAA